jgi:enamine deaminase RidA (YjgF/YER057c/UK114 family)
MHLTYLNSPELPDWRRLFSQVVVTEGSPLRIVAISGQVGVDERQVVSGDGGFSAQAKKAFVNLVIALSAAGCSVADVVKLTIYVVAMSRKRPE